MTSVEFFQGHFDTDAGFFFFVVKFVGVVYAQ